MADRTGLEPATSGVTGRHSNQLNYRSAIFAQTLFHGRRLRLNSLSQIWWVMTGSNRRPAACKAAALPAELITQYIFLPKNIKKRKMADRTGLEPATSGVTGRHSNQLNYRSAIFAQTLFHGRRLRLNSLSQIWWVMTGSNRRPAACKAAALPAELITQYIFLPKNI